MGQTLCLLLQLALIAVDLITYASIQQDSKGDDMSRTFSDDTENASVLFRRAQRLAKENNVKLTGDETAGRFSGPNIAGTYRIEGETVTVTYTEKPSTVSWFVLGSLTRNFIR